LDPVRCGDGAGRCPRDQKVAHVRALRVADLPLHHHDPFDRILIAQAQVEGFPIVTADLSFDGYDVHTMRAVA